MNTEKPPQERGPGGEVNTENPPQERGPGGEVNTENPPQERGPGGEVNTELPFSLTLVPLINEQFSFNEYGTINKSEIGTAIFGNIGRHIGFSFGISKGFQSEQLANTVYFTPEPGQRWNPYSGGGGDYFDWTGQVMASWKWGSFGIIRDRINWGNNYNGANIFISKPPSFPHIRLHVKPAKWIEFSFISGMLQSNLVDSNRTFSEGDGTKTFYRQKYLTANLVTFIPWKDLNISFGNSVIYGDKFELAYTIPLLFYKSVDHTMNPEAGLTGGTNSQMFLDISSRQIRHLHLYLTLFADEFKMSRVYSSKEHNFLGWKGGFRLSGFPIQNLSFTAEGTSTLPMVYQHNVIITTFESDGYNFGNYLRDNSREVYLSLDYRPLSRLLVALSYTWSWHGDNYVYATEPNPTTVPVFQNMTWQNRSFCLFSSWSLSGNASVFLSYENSLKKGDVQFNSPSFQGGTNTVSAGVRVGF
ncbi:MAG: hypothetical protein NTW10_11980 [Bacteroidetes bacterium]|nr:hypothetical protein [Bacteroidota bacterium]